jgi:hypothetical protein
MCPTGHSKTRSGWFQSLTHETAICSLALLVVGLTVIMLTYSDYGIPWDDYFQAIYGKLVAKYFSSGFKDKACNELSDLRYYGPLFELLTSVAFPSGGGYPIFALRRLFIALTGLGTILGGIQLARRLDIKLVPTFAVLSLVFMPRFYGHSYINSKDIPFACAFTWFQVILCCVLLSPKIPWRRVILGGIGFGLVMAIRPGGLALTVVLTLLVIGYLWLTGNSPFLRWRKENSAGLLILKGLVLVTTAWGLMIAFWPWAHENPFVNPILAMRQAVRFHNVYPVLFEGLIYHSNSLPWYYLAKTLVITAPIPILCLAAVGMFFAVKLQIQQTSSSLSVVLFLIQSWIFAPIALATVMRPQIYDGLRHFLFLLPGIALLAGYGAACLIRLVQRTNLRLLVTFGLVIMVSQSLVPIIRLHPYQYCYFNALTGGLLGAEGRYETDYWVTSYKEAAEWINAQARKQFPGDQQAFVLVAANSLSIACAQYYLDKSMGIGKVLQSGLRGPMPKPYHYYLATTRYALDKNFDEAPIVKTIGRDGAVFTVIKSTHHTD